VKQEIGHQIVRHEEIDAAIVVVVAEDHAKALAVGSVDARRSRDIAERAVAIVPVQDAGGAVVDVRAAVRAHAAVAAGLAVVFRIDVVRHEQVEAAIVVDVGERAARAEGRSADTGGPGHVGERAVAVVPVSTSPRSSSGRFAPSLS
jgi:hypothetical protein